jgi:long chain fatty acid CoA FadD26
MIQNPRGTVGEIWVHGERVAIGYRRKAEQTARTFNAPNINPASGTPAGPSLRTADLGVISDGELFICWVLGRIKVAAISVPDGTTEQLAAIVEAEATGGFRGRGQAQTLLGET